MLPGIHCTSLKGKSQRYAHSVDLIQSYAFTLFLDYLNDFVGLCNASHVFQNLLLWNDKIGCKNAFLCSY